MVTSISRWPKLPSWASHRRRKGCGLAGAEGKWASCLARRFSFSAIAFLKSVLSVLFKSAFSFSRRRIRVRVLNAERKNSYRVQDEFTGFFKFSSVKETIRKFHSCRKLKKGPHLLVRKPSSLGQTSTTKFHKNWNQWRLAWQAFLGLYCSKIA